MMVVILYSLWEEIGEEDGGDEGLGRKVGEGGIIEEEVREALG